jgi:hypothetical protein
MLGKTDLAKLAGLPPTTLQKWVEAGYATPAASHGVGRGMGHEFDVMTCVGVVVAAEVRRSAQSATPAYVGHIIRAFAEQTEKHLATQLRRGATYFCGAFPARRGQFVLVLDGPDYPNDDKGGNTRPVENYIGRPDVGAIYAAVTAAVAVAKAEVQSYTPTRD